MTRIDKNELKQRILSLTEGEDDEISLMATIVAELFHGVEGWDWVGFYRVTAPKLLKIGPYQGGHGCLVIPFDKGVCGAAALQEKTQRVDDVNDFPGHIACAASTESEIVVPVRNGAGNLIAVLDIDSDQPAFFSVEDQVFLEGLMDQIFSRT